MKLFDILSQFKNIEPTRDFSERSRREILVSPRKERAAMRGVFVFLHAMETGAAVALAGLFILLLTGEFSNSPSVVPIQPAVIDPAVLHAEAQAIDMQIQLADVEYAQVTSTAANGTILAAPGTLKDAIGKAIGAAATSTTAGVAGGESTSTASTTPMAVDQALQQLAH